MHLHAYRGRTAPELILEKILKLIIIIIMMKNRKNFLICRAAERHFQHSGGPRNVSVDLKYDVLCL